ncbi:hypothetical protein quinque_001919 [Culex quinquefasciatus]
MTRKTVLLFAVVLAGCWCATAANGQSNATDPSGSSSQSLSRRKRFLLFPFNAQVVITVSGAKSMIYKSPGLGFTVLEMDMYYPLPDYRFRFSQFRLGEIAMLPSVAPPPPPTTTTPSTTTAAAPASSGDHHDGHEVSAMEVQQYLKDHPDTWVPPGYGKERSDWFPAGTYNPYANKWQQSYSNPKYRQPYSRKGSYLSNRRKAWSSSPANNHQYIPRMKRSTEQPEPDEGQYELEEEPDRFNISHLRDWEHFHHYRERRELFHTLETGLGSKFDIPMRACLMRSICEARGLLLPRGKSMITDIVRIILNVPLRADLQDDYSKAMRDDGADCRELYGRNCPISLLYLLLLGKFVP